LVVLNWKPRKVVSKLPLESFFESFATAIRYASHAPGIQVVLFRNVLFTLFIAVVPALLPVVGLRELHLSPSAGICWTIAASELWVAGQRAMPGWDRGRMNATIIMIGQGAIALGGVVWGSSAVFFGPT
jgi:Transmembrane secretion effector